MITLRKALVTALLVCALFLGNLPAAPAQELNGEDASGSEGTGLAIYTFFVNIIHEPFRFPLIGFVNIFRGNHTFPQIGFVNWNTGDFSPWQFGFVNTAGGDLNGTQTGFVNTAIGDTSGLQFGFVNTTRSFSGAQIGFVNTVSQESRGLQLGFVNTSVQTLTGTQIGFVNFADSIEDGLPIGFISIVRHGGFRAVEYSFSEFFYFNVGLKLGVEIFYTTIFAAYNSVTEFDAEYFAIGLGFGTIIPITGSFFFNPELNSMSAFMNGGNRQFLSFVPYVGFNISQRLSIAIAPSVTWVRTETDSLPSPSFSMMEHSINESNSIVVGARAALRFRF